MIVTYVTQHEIINEGWILIMNDMGNDSETEPHKSELPSEPEPVSESCQFDMVTCKSDIEHLPSL